MYDAVLSPAIAGVPGVFAFYVHDVQSGARWSLRADEAYPAASIIKLPVMLRVLEMVQQGTAALDQTARLAEWHKTGGSGVFQFFHEGLEVTLDDALTAMIALSDNTATNLLLDVTGVSPVNDLLDRLGCPRTRLHRYFGKPEMPGPPGPSQAVPSEIGRLLEHLVCGDVLTPDLCDHALRQLRRQGHRALLPRLLPESTPVAHKTGSLDGVRHDAGIFWRPAGDRARPRRPRDVMAREGAGQVTPPTGHPVVFVGMSRAVQDRRWTVENAAEVAIARAARAVYDALAGQPADRAGRAGEGRSAPGGRVATPPAPTRRPLRPRRRR